MTAHFRKTTLKTACRDEDAPKGCCILYSGYQAIQTIVLKFPRVSGGRRENLKPTPAGAGGVGYFYPGTRFTICQTTFQKDGWTAVMTTLDQNCLIRHVCSILQTSTQLQDPKDGSEVTGCLVSL